MSDLQGYQYPLTERVRNGKATGTLDELIFPTVPTHKIWVVTNLAIQDTTTAFTSLRALLRGSGYDHYLLEDYALLAGRLYWFTGQIWIPERHYLVVQIVGATASDVLLAHANGFQLDQPEGG
jgi:hypothetical protein